MNNEIIDHLCPHRISVGSGTRPSGTTIDVRKSGRRYCGLLYIWSGSVSIYDEGGKNIVASSGDLLCLPKKSRYKLTYAAPLTTFVLVNFELSDIGGNEIALFENIEILAHDDPSNHHIAKVMRNFELSGASKTVNTTLVRKELIFRLFSVIYASTGGLLVGREIDSRIFPGIRLLEQTYLENLPIEFFSEMCHLSVGTFRRLFQKQFGTSPLKYRNHLRIDRARELLSEGCTSVAEAAYHSGFEDVAYFCKYYRQITGETPGETKKRSQS